MRKIKRTVIPCILGFLVICFSGCGGGGGSGSSSPEVIDLGNLAIWTFDETTGAVAFNSGFSGINGNVNAATRVAGISGNAYDFSANLPSYISFPLFDSTGTIVIDFPQNEIAIDFWINLSNSSNPSTYLLFGNGQSGIKSFQIIFDNGDFSFRFYTPASNGGSFVELVRSNFMFNANEWHYIAFTLDSNGATVYINGQPNTVSGNLVFDLQEVFNTLYLGGGVSNFNSFPGVIDELRFSDLTFSAQEIEEYYIQTVP